MWKTKKHGKRKTFISLQSKSKRRRKAAERQQLLFVIFILVFSLLIVLSLLNKLPVKVTVTRGTKTCPNGSDISKYLTKLNFYENNNGENFMTCDTSSTSQTYLETGQHPCDAIIVRSATCVNVNNQLSLLTSSKTPVWTCTFDFSQKLPRGRKSYRPKLASNGVSCSLADNEDIRKAKPICTPCRLSYYVEETSGVWFLGSQIALLMDVGTQATDLAAYFLTPLAYLFAGILFLLLLQALGSCISKSTTSQRFMPSQFTLRINNKTNSKSQRSRSKRAESEDSDSSSSGVLTRLIGAVKRFITPISYPDSDSDHEDSDTDTTRSRSSSQSSSSTSQSESSEDTRSPPSARSKARPYLRVRRMSLGR